MHCRSPRIPFLLAMVFAFSTARAHAEVFKLREHLGRHWLGDFVTFSTSQSPGDRWQLVDQADHVLPFQWIDQQGKDPKIGFQVDLKPYAENTYRFIKQETATETQTDLRIERRPDELRIDNSKIGLALRTRAPNGSLGPIAAVKLNSGKWVGDSELLTDQPIAAWNVRIVADGPVYVEAVVDIKFADESEWVTRYRIYAGQPVVLVDEHFTVKGAAEFRLRLDRRFDPQSLFYRLGKQSSSGRVGTNATAPIRPGLVFQLEPWLHWWEAERRGAALSIYNSQGKDLLSLAARHAGVWVDPSIPIAYRATPSIKVVKDESGLHADFPIALGARSWMIGCHDRDESLAVMTDKATKIDSPIPYRYLIKYGHFPLNLIKDYQLQWESNVVRPRMLVQRDDVQRLLARSADVRPYEKKAAYYVDHPPTLTVGSLDDAIPAMLITQDDRLGSRLSVMCEGLIDQWVASLLDQNGMPFGAAPHEKSTIASSIALADLLYDTKYFSDEQRRRVSAKIAFLGYTFARPEYWSVERGFAANPNMTTTVYGYRTSIACFLSDHPEAEGWAHESLRELLQRLNAWSDSEGGWLEAPHYAVVSYDQILGALVMAQKAGFSDALFGNPKVKSVARWLAKINTPPDSRIGGYRHHPAIGHTYVNEPCGDFGLLAYLFQQRDPTFAAEMQWQFVQNNMYSSAGIGGFFPAFAGFRKLLTDPNLPAKPPDYKSQLFPKTGAVLRDRYPSPRETYLHLILGRHREHYDDDSGSIVLYGKGRVLIDEFGYTGRAPASDHSMVECVDVRDQAMQPDLFVTSSHFDYIEGRRGPWTRQIILIKGTSPDDPAYFVINDTVESRLPVTWRLWLAADQVRLTSRASALVDGGEDVDMDVVFFAPHELRLSIEEKTRRSGSGLHPNWTWRPIETKQTGLIARSDSENGVHRISAVLFPRLKTSQPAQVTKMSGGNGIKVDHDSGTDYVFLSDLPLKHAADRIEFEGRAGIIQLRGGAPILKLAGPGRIAAGGKTVSRRQD